ncbi:MAG: NYN domain-containing protein [Armatimonadetes bacterium]|nr:NYN domain-containing protein [Armatimonadota bacterium]GBC90719.1 hypothetical protein HRbin14_01469 [bacterium HR14]
MMAIAETIVKNRSTIQQSRKRATSARKVLVMVDVQNMIHPDLRLDYEELLRFCQQFGQIEQAVAFITDKPETMSFQLMLKQAGYEVHRIYPFQNGNGELKCNADVEMAFWLGRAVERYRLKRGDMVVICTGDGDFARIVEWFRSRDIQVAVICYGKSASSRLRVVADRFYAIEETPSLSRRKYEEREGAMLRQDFTP